MNPLERRKAPSDAVQRILGYLNFSTGNFDPVFFRSLNELAAEFAAADDPQPFAVALPARLRAALASAAEESAAFRDCQQARRVIDLVFDQALPRYSRDHADLVADLARGDAFNSFFVGRVCQAVLQAWQPEALDAAIVTAALEQLNDYIGYRPVAVLTSQDIKPYPGEWSRPIPIYLREVGPAVGRYAALLAATLETLAATNPDLLRLAHFALGNLDELALDMRAYDFDHPVNKRPNYHFGQWDPHCLGPDQTYRRFILHRVILDALLERVEAGPPESRAELLREAATVLGGTILMAAGVCGSSPFTYDSNTTLESLVPLIASSRDAYYDEWIQRMPEPHRQRLRDEGRLRHQAFGGARQHLNAKLAEQRAAQLVRVHLATAYARMGYLEAARRHADIVQVASARTVCQIDCLLTAGRSLIQAGHLDKALTVVSQIMDLVQRGINCGAIVDPWNLLGFDGNFSLFPAQANTVRDHRVDELVELIEQILAYCSQLLAEAAARDDQPLCGRIKLQLQYIANWWHQFAPHEVSSAGAVNPKEIVDSAELVARALNLWHKGGAAAGDMDFWARYAQIFDSPQAYHLVIDALMQRNDLSTAMALLVHWLSRSDSVPLRAGETSFHDFTRRWLGQHRTGADPAAAGEERDEAWNRVRRFLELVEANAEEYGRVPDFQPEGLSLRLTSLAEEEELPPDENDEPDESTDSLYGAAYDGVVYRDSTDDGQESETFDTEHASEDALEAEVDRVADRLEFLETLAGAWRVAAALHLPRRLADPDPDRRDELLRRRRELLLQWRRQALANRHDLERLLHTVAQYRLPKPASDADSLVEYDRFRLFKESLIDKIIGTCIETENAIRTIDASCLAIDQAGAEPGATSAAAASPDITAEPPREFAPIFAAIALGEPAQVSALCGQVIEQLQDAALLYVPLAKGGQPLEIVEARSRQDAIKELVRHLARMGLFEETHQVCAAALAMERNHRVGPGAVTEFDELFKIAFMSMVEALVASTEHYRQARGGRGPRGADIDADEMLFDCLETLTESMLLMWLQHDETLRLSVLERVADNGAWTRLVEFINDYGHDLLTQKLLQLGNIRAILHQGSEVWLKQLKQVPEAEDYRIVTDLGDKLPLAKASSYLTLIFEAVLENYNEYRDYNSTTTQSDRGELLYTFLDFLRLKVRYDRISWRLRPFVWAQRVLVERSDNKVARKWRRSLAERVQLEADRNLSLFHELQVKYAMQMMTVHERLAEKFVQPMYVDRLRSLVRQAMATPRGAGSKRAFEMLEQEVTHLMTQPTGVGIDLPHWLAALEEEVELGLLPDYLRSDLTRNCLFEFQPVPLAELRERLERLPSRQ